MRKFETTVIVIAVAVVILMGLLPPWSVTGEIGNNYPGVVFSMGYHPIFSAPLLGEISFGRLLVQWVLVGVVAATMVYFQSAFLVFVNAVRHPIARGFAVITDRSTWTETK